MLLARVTAFTLLLGAILWIGSGHLRPAEPPAPPARVSETAKPPFKVVVTSIQLVPHARKLALTGRTQSDQRVLVSARTNGIISHIAVRKGASVKPGDLIAELSDEAREANVAQARSRLAQRRAELEAREQLAKRGNFPTLNLEQLRAEKQAAEAALAAAEAELLRTSIAAPIAGIVNDLPVEIGQGLAMGATIAEIIAPDPMLAVIEVPERRLAGIRLGEATDIRLVTGETRTGKITFIGRKPNGQTRTYRVEIAFPNPDGTIPDGVAAEVGLVLAPEPATRLARSALTFSSEGQLGVRIAGPGDIVAFVPVMLIDDEESHLWVNGLKDGMRVIIRGQDFVLEGQKVETAEEPALAAASKGDGAPAP